MNIVVLTGSPRGEGNSNVLASEFARGAQDAGHGVFRFDSAKHKIHPCIGCEKCHMDGPCIFQDDFNLVRGKLLDADLIAFATPLYYFGFSSQLKTLIDRFFSINLKIMGNRQAVLMSVQANPRREYTDALISHYMTMLEYLKWADAGRITASGARNIGDIQKTKYPGEAYNLGKNL